MFLDFYINTYVKLIKIKCFFHSDFDILFSQALLENELIYNILSAFINVLLKSNLTPISK